MAPTSACPTENAILSLVRGTLHDGDGRVRAHVDVCTTCQELLACALDSTSVARASGPRVKERASSSLVDRTIGRYHVRDVLGAGAMGIVYLADDMQLERSVAVKVLHGQHLEASERLTREAKALARLSHPNVIVVHEVGTFEDHVFMAMEFVDGCSLTAWLAATVRTTDEILRIFAQAGRGLAVAHVAGLVHRDFKPDNVLVGHDGRVRVVDFGLAREDVVSLPAPDDGGASPARAHGGLRTLTRTGAFVGTPAYMAPEQYAGRPVDARTDQFGFAVALFEALYGRRPFEGDSIEALARSVQSGNVRIPRRSSGGRLVPGRVRRALLRALRVEPDERFASMDALLEALSPATRSLRALVVVAIVALTGGGWAALHARTSDAEPSSEAALGSSDRASPLPAGASSARAPSKEEVQEAPRPIAGGAPPESSAVAPAAATIRKVRDVVPPSASGARNPRGAPPNAAIDSKGTTEQRSDAGRTVDAGRPELFDTTR